MVDQDDRRLPHAESRRGENRRLERFPCSTSRWPSSRATSSCSRSTIAITWAAPARIRPELTGDHTWYLNTSVGQPRDYPNASISPDELEDLAFRGYAQPSPLPHD